MQKLDGRSRLKNLYGGKNGVVAQIASTESVPPTILMLEDKKKRDTTIMCVRDCGIVHDGKDKAHRLWAES